MKTSSLLRLAPVAGLALSSLLYSCDPKSKVDPQPDPGPQAARHDSVYVINEGQFGTPNGSVSLYVKSTKASEKDPFQRVNSRTLGDVVQSMTVVGNKGYVVVNNSNKVEVVNLPDFRSAGTITGLALPRYLVAASADRAYLTEWVSFGQPGRVSVVDLRTNAVWTTVPVGKLPEQPLLLGEKLYVPNSDENTLTVISTPFFQVETTLTISDGPNSLAKDAAGNIWVLCSGLTRYNPQPPYNVLSSTPAKLVRLNPSAPTTGRLELSFASGGASNLQVSPDGQQLYYRYGGAVYRMATTATALPTTPLIRRRFNGIGVDPADGTLYGGVGNYATDGRTVHYSLTGAPVDSFSVGIGPSGFSFR